MSNALRFDPPLVRALAAELSAALSGRPAHPLPVFDRDLSATLPLGGGEALRFDLHPSRGWVRVAPLAECVSAEVLASLEGGPPPARIVRVTAPADERLLKIDLREGNRFRGGARSLIVELHTNQWNALVVDSDDRRIVSLLRARDAGGRSLRSGAVYEPPAPQRRLGADHPHRDDLFGDWRFYLGPLPPGDRRAELLRSFAYTSPVNASAILGSAGVVDAEAELEKAFERWWRVLTSVDAEPVLLDTPRGRQPYPLPLDGFASVPFESILRAMDALAASADPEEPAKADAAKLLESARRRLDGARKRVARLYGELENVGEADKLRARGDLLLAHLHLIPAGAASVTLPAFEGGEVEIPLDPALKPHENAARWYDEARRRSRAEERLPELIERGEAEVRRWEEAVAAAEAGEPPAWLEGALRRGEQKQAQAKKAPVAPRLPYRVFRTAGGLEVRVGRSSKDNDQLTFRHAHPEDVWLHARSVPGSHVVLRWPGEGAPPARDLEEAATLAALYSKARSSRTVAVDWTRRKYVRKPRGAPPGRVMISHAKTVFVEPDPAVEERMKEPDPAAG